jgi:hypothetical protein
MASKSTKIRASFYRIAFGAGLLFGGATNAFGKLNVNTTTGSTDGIFHETPEWSAGVQIGRKSITGISIQKIGFNEGALNLGIGSAFGFSLQADYLLFFDSNLDQVSLNESQGYLQQRGKALFYGGAGGILGDGIALHVPIGVQYTMIMDPVSFFGEIGMTLGPVFGDRKDDQINLAWSAGIRVLL